LDKYYNLIDESPVYISSLVLNPGHSWRYIERRWATNQEWVEAAKTAVRAFYEENWKGSDIEPLQPQTNTATTRELDAFEAFLTPADYYEPTPSIDEYESYIALIPKRVDNILQWWRDHEAEYPHLARMAFDLLSIPAMAAECERTFSLAKLLITQQRNRMNEDTIEATQCLKNWWNDRD
jgi:hypothetical protein